MKCPQKLLFESVAFCNQKKIVLMWKRIMNLKTGIPLVVFFFFFQGKMIFFRKTENFLCWQQNPIFSSKLIGQTFWILFFSTLLRTSKSSKTSFQKICYHEEFCLILEGTFSLWYVMLSSLLSCWFMYSFFWIQNLKFLKREKK